jgi:flagellar biosynthesis chaperone FliJ
MKAYPIFDEDGETIMIVEHLRDITEIKRSEENLMKANQELANAYESLKSLDRLKNEFLSNLQPRSIRPLQVSKVSVNLYMTKILGH